MNFEESYIYITDSYGRKVPFDPDIVQGKLVNSCISTGLKDFFIAEDIANAVENTLRYKLDSGITYSYAEINSIIVKFLEEAGYKELAYDFKLKNNTFNDSQVELNFDSIFEMIRQKFDMKQIELSILTKNVIEACHKLAIIKTTPSLILELAAHYRAIMLNEAEFSVKHEFSSKKRVIKNSEILPYLSDFSKMLLESNILELSGISTLYPSVKIAVRFEKLAEHYSLKPTITEMQLFPCFELPQQGINEIVTVANKYMNSNNDDFSIKELPVFIAFPDIYIFAKKYFGVIKPEKSALCRNIANSFAELFTYHVTIKGVK